MNRDILNDQMYLAGADTHVKSDKHPAMVIVQPHIIWNAEAEDDANGNEPRPWAWGHTIKTRASATDDLYFSEASNKVASWLEARDYRKVEELTYKQFSSPVDGIYRRKVHS